MRIPRSFGRLAFGDDPARYHRARPAYPDWVFDTLKTRCGLQSKISAFEIGAGTGTATQRLLQLGVNPLVAIEPDPRLAEFLRAHNPAAALRLIVAPFEDAGLDEAQFDLGLSATAFHWLDEGAALAKVGRLLRPGGWWAAVWNEFGDDRRPDPFHEATKELLGAPSSPSAGEQGVTFAMDVEARLAALSRAGAFDEGHHDARTWTLVLDWKQTVDLYSTYSNVNARADRDEVLIELGRIAREQFNNSVTRNMVTSLYIARRSTST